MRSLFRLKVIGGATGGPRGPWTLNNLGKAPSPHYRRSP